ncbi:MAG: hypothetical protein ABIR96_02525 [Bdellovibrionota bacterium]
MRNTFALRAVSTLVICSYALTTIASEAPGTKHVLSHDALVGSQALEDYVGVYQEAKTAYDTRGPEAFVTRLGDAIPDKAGREKVLKTLSKLPQLPELSRCGDNCLELMSEGQKVQIDVSRLSTGSFAINGETFKIDSTRDTFTPKVDEVELFLQKNLGSSASSNGIVSDTIAKVCSIFIPQAHAEMSSLAKAIVIGVVAIVAVIAVWWIGKKIIDRAEHKANNVVREADSKAKKRIRQGERSARDRIDQAVHGGKQIIHRATIDARGIINKAQRTDTTDDTPPPTNDAVDSGGYSPDADPVVGNDPRGSLNPQ